MVKNTFTWHKHVLKIETNDEYRRAISKNATVSLNYFKSLVLIAWYSAKYNHHFCFHLYSCYTGSETNV
jgi:hypothetical protein